MYDYDLVFGKSATNQNSGVRALILLRRLQTILVGDSGVGKTSLLVQFDQGKFQPGSFAATVGIGFMVGLRHRSKQAVVQRGLQGCAGFVEVPLS